MRDMCENFGIEVITTPGYSPWRNGTCERHNLILTEILVKLKESHGYDWEVSLCWAVVAKNTLNSVNGFSPYQTVFGRNPNLPSAFGDKLPALEGQTNSKIVASHINAMYAARKDFVKVERSERIRRALRKNTRNNDVLYKSGDKVY